MTISCLESSSELPRKGRFNIEKRKTMVKEMKSGFLDYNLNNTDFVKFMG